MPENSNVERRQTMRAFGARLVLVPVRAAWNGARHREKMRDEGRGIIYRPVLSPDNPVAHCVTGPEL